MKKIFFLLLLFFLCIVLTCVHAASPTYDDNPPPSYIWGSGGLNPQTSGTPNKNGEQRIDDSIHEVNVTVGSISVDTSNIENSTNAINSNVSDIKSDVSDIKTDISSISSNIGELITSQSASDVTIASISVDTSNIDNKLVATYTTQFDTYQRTVGEMLKNISQYYGNDSGSINQNIFNILNDLVMQYSSITSIEQGVSGLVKTSQPNILKTVRLNLSANTATQISPISVTGNRNRVFVELRAIDPDTEFYVGFDSTVTDSTGRPVKGRILLNMPSSQALYIYHINSSAIDVQQTEGWR